MTSTSILPLTGTELSVYVEDQTHTDISIQYQTRVPGMRYASAAYSLVTLSITYRGPIARIRRLFDNVETDVYEYKNKLWTARFGRGLSINTWANGDSVAVVAWFDQSGKGHHAIQTDGTKQPILKTDSGAGGIHFSQGHSLFTEVPNDQSQERVFPTRSYCIHMNFDGSGEGTKLSMVDTELKTQILLENSNWSDQDGALINMPVPTGSAYLTIQYDSIQGIMSAESDTGEISVEASTLEGPFHMGDASGLGHPRYLEIAVSSGKTATMKQLILFDFGDDGIAPVHEEFAFISPTIDDGGGFSNRSQLGQESLIIHGYYDTTPNEEEANTIYTNTIKDPLMLCDRIRHVATSHLWQVCSKDFCIPDQNDADELSEDKFLSALAIGQRDVVVWNRMQLSNILDVASEITVEGTSTFKHDMMTLGQRTILSNATSVDVYAPTVTLSNASMFIGRNVYVHDELKVAGTGHFLSGIIVNQDTMVGGTTVIRGDFITSGGDRTTLSNTVTVDVYAPLVTLSNAEVHIGRDLVVQGDIIASGGERTALSNTVTMDVYAPLVTLSNAEVHVGRDLVVQGDIIASGGARTALSNTVAMDVYAPLVTLSNAEMYVGRDIIVQGDIVASGGARTALSNTVAVDVYAPLVTLSNAEVHIGRDLVVQGNILCHTPREAHLPEAGPVIFDPLMDCGMIVRPSSLSGVSRIAIGNETFIQADPLVGASVHIGTHRLLSLTSQGCLGLGNTEMMPGTAQLEIRPTNDDRAVIAFQDPSGTGRNHTIQCHHMSTRGEDGVHVTLSDAILPTLSITPSVIWTPNDLAIGRQKIVDKSIIQNPIIQLDNQPSSCKLILLAPSSPSLTAFHGLGATTQEVQYRAPDSTVDHVMYGGHLGQQELFRIASSNGVEKVNCKGILSGSNIDASGGFMLGGVTVLDKTVSSQVTLRNIQRLDVNMPSNLPIDDQISIRTTGNVELFSHNTQGVALTMHGLCLMSMGVTDTGTSYIKSDGEDGLQFRLSSLAVPTGSNLVIQSGANPDVSAMTISQDNKVGIAFSNGNVPMTYALEVKGDVYADGDVLCRSDICEKENIEAIKDALNKIMALNGVMYTTVNGDSRRHMGLIAQEVNAVIPEVVRHDHENGRLSVAYGNIVAILIEGMKQLVSEIRSLKMLLVN